MYDLKALHQLLFFVVLSPLNLGVIQNYTPFINYFVRNGWRYLPSGHYTSFKALILKKCIIRFKLIHILIVIGLWSVMQEVVFVINDWNRRSLMKKRSSSLQWKIAFNGDINRYLN